MTSSKLTTTVAAALLALTFAAIATAHVPPAPTTPSSPPTDSSSPPSPPAPATPSSPPTDSSSPPSPPTPTTPSTPSSPPDDVHDPPCCDALKGVPGCKDQIYKTYTTISGGAVAAKEASINVGGSYAKLGSSCCEIVNSIGDVCWKMMFPKCPVAAFFRGVCSVFGADDKKPTLINTMQCLGALRKVPGCMKQINETASLITQFTVKGAKTHKGMHVEVVGMGQSCCSVAGGITDDCWKQMYPKYPAVPRVVKGVCSLVDRSGGVKSAILEHRAEMKKGSDNIKGHAKLPVVPPVVA